MTVAAFLPFLGAALLAPLAVQADVLDFELIELGIEDTHKLPSIDFADQNTRHDEWPECKAFPGSEDWPSACDWARLNAALDGALLKPSPPAIVCYEGAEEHDEDQCEFLVNQAGRTSFYIDDPVQILSSWPQGSTCMPAINATGTCTQGGFPEYVVNATTVRDVQAAVNFARNKNIRVVIKNTGHSFGGRSTGAGSLSIWTHHLKSFEFIPEYTEGSYTGMAVRFGAGLQAWELYNYMYEHDIAVVAPGGRTVGANGGWFAMGGHGNLASYYGLGADNALELHVVTADGRFVAASSDRNEDLFYALRGGGGSTYGVVTSVVMKAYPPIDIVTATLSWQVNNGEESPNSTVVADDLETFWSGVNTYFRFETDIIDAGGADWNYLWPLGEEDSFLFTTRVSYPGKTEEEAEELLQPIVDALVEAGLNMTMPEGLTPSPYASRNDAPAAPLANTRYRSRLLPRANWEDDELFAKTMAVIRTSIEAGYTYHGLSYGATEEVAGWPGNTAAVNPAWREAVTHAILLEMQSSEYTAQEAREEEARIQRYMQEWRDLSPGAGSYMNEGDPGEPEWQQSFYGTNYESLLTIKARRDPWAVFWAPTTPGSEAWEVRTADGYPRSQNGRLCRADM